MTTTMTADQTLDARGIACPLVMAKTKMALEKMESGQVLEVLTTDACTEFDIPSWVKRTGKELMATVKEQDTIKFFIKKL